MSQPTTQPGAPGAPVSVPIGALLQALHDRYGKLIQQIIQENAELQAGIEQQGAELAYLRSVVQAHEEANQDAPGPVDGNPGAAAPSPLG